MYPLASYAAHAEHSPGRSHTEQESEHRNPYQRDRDRIIHCSAFRRLQYKTQVFVNHEGDMFRSRLTHSIEVAQIARTVARELDLNEDLTEAICLAHDLGHTPFGHAGQEALNRCMNGHGGFEHNLQSLRVVDLLEQRYADFPGLNLMYETREGILKHCSRAKAKTLGQLGKRFVDNKQPSLEAQLANIADEIAYNNHDVDDGLRANILTISALCECQLIDEQIQKIRKEGFNLSEKQLSNELVRRMINELVTDLISTSRKNIIDSGVDSIAGVRALSKPLIGLSKDVCDKHNQLKQYLRKNLYTHKRVISVAAHSKVVIKDLFNLYASEPGLIPMNNNMYSSGKESEDSADKRVIEVKDYIAGMTDRFALTEHERFIASGSYNIEELSYG